MRFRRRPPTTLRLLSAGALLCALVAPLQAQLLTPDYTLTAPGWKQPASSWSVETASQQPVAAWGTVRLAAGGSFSGNGLSLEAGEKWFARAGIGRSLENGAVSLGGGYRFLGGDALSMHVTRQPGQERLGLAVRYDWQHSYLRLAYESLLRVQGSNDLRFSAGVRF